MPTILLGSILLEPNRWTKEKNPSLRVSEWGERIRAAGFGGIELWENHYRKPVGGEAERAALAAMRPASWLYNSYASLGQEGADDRDAATEAVWALGDRVTGVKFNVGPGGDADRLAAELRTAREWATRLPPRVRLLCECHPGSALETPEAAQAAFEGEWANPQRFGAIVHPFSIAPEVLQEWAERFGTRILHLHVQARTPENKIVCLQDRAAEARESLRILREAGVIGRDGQGASATLEFTGGISTPEGDVPEKLWDNALKDQAFLWEHWNG